MSKDTATSHDPATKPGGTGAGAAKKPLRQRPRPYDTYEPRTMAGVPADTSLQARYLRQPATKFKNVIADKSVEITLALPSLASLKRIGSALRTRLSRLSTRQLAAVILLGFSCLAIAAFMASLMVPRSGQPASAADRQAAGGTAGASQAPVLQRGNPDYGTVIPAGKSISQLGGWTRVSPPDRNPVYAYADTIGKTGIAVSQQPLPKDFRDDTPAKLEELAKHYNATEKVTIAGTVIHIGTSAKGPQSVIFNKNDLLILIKSDAPLSTDQWAAYISSLK